MQKKLGPRNKDDDQEDDEDDNDSITVKQLPTARDKLVEDRDKLIQTLPHLGMPGKEDPEATVPRPVISTAKDVKKDGSGEIIPLVETVKDVAKAVAIDEKVAKKANEAKEMAKKRGGGRRLLGVPGDIKNEIVLGPVVKTRIADSALESLAELYKNTKAMEKKQKLWKEVVVPLPADQREKFAQIVGGSPMPVDVEDTSKEPVIQPSDIKSKTPLAKTKPEAASKTDLHHVTHTEGCLVYGAIVAEKVPATIRFQAKSKWHNFVSHHLGKNKSVCWKTLKTCCSFFLTPLPLSPPFFSTSL